jgi:hypothetical protein
MWKPPGPMQNLNDLRDFVLKTLCDHHELEIGAFPLTERILLRSAKPCGVYFCLHGPRAVKFSAIWETERNSILFYGATGERFLKIQLIAAPKLEAVAA